MSLALVCATLEMSAQANEGELISRRGSVRLMPVFQRWSMQGGADFSEVSVALSLVQPIGRQASFTLRGAGASASGDVPSLKGLADAQLGLNYYWEATHLLFSLGFNLPSGHKELTSDEFQTSLVLSNSVFDMSVPSFGTGVNINPGVIWAFRVNDNFSTGLGVSYQRKGTFKPAKGLGDYDPGDEVLLTTGVDIKLAEATTFSVDAIFTTFGKDKLNGKDVFASGNKIVMNAQFRKHFGFDQLWLLLRYRSKAKNEFAVGNTFFPEPEKLEPDNIEARAIYTIRFSEHVSLGIMAEGRFYKETPALFSGIKLFGFGVMPEFSLSPDVSIPIRLRIQHGSTKGGKTVTGVDAGLGITFGI